MLDPVRKTVEVPCSQGDAFDVFISERESWWPLTTRAMSVQAGESAEELRGTPSEGGKIIEVSEEGTEHHWDTFTSYDPPASVTMDVYMGLPPDLAREVEVEFASLGDDQTRVEITQRNWEAVRDMVEMKRENYESSSGLIFEDTYKSTCSS